MCRYTVSHEVRLLVKEPAEVELAVSFFFNLIPAVVVIGENVTILKMEVNAYLKLSSAYLTANEECILDI